MAKRILHILISLVVIFMTMDMTAQVLMRSRNMPRVGDRISIDIVSLSDAGRSGDTVVWDFRNVPVVTSNEHITYTGTDGQLFTTKFSKFRVEYRQHADTLFKTGYENRRILMSDSIGAVRIVYPMAFGDSCVSQFTFRGRCDVDVHAINKGFSQTLIDGRGIMLLPDGDTVPDVLRVCYENRSSVDMWRHISHTSLTSIPDSAEVVYREYEWYAPGYRYPLLYMSEIEVPSSDRETIPLLAYICSRSSQEYDVRNDKENEEIRQSIKTEMNTDIDREVQKQSVQNIDLVNDGEQIHVDFDYSGANIGYLELIVADSRGLTFMTLPRQKVEPGHNRITVDIGSLASGEYVLFIVDGETRITTKFTTR